MWLYHAELGTTRTELELEVKLMPSFYAELLAKNRFKLLKISLACTTFLRLFLFSLFWLL